MRKWLFRLLILGAVALAGFWGWRIFFPSPENAIRQRLLELARTASFSGNEGALAKLDNVQRLAAGCTRDIEVTLDAQGYPRVSLVGQDELLQGAGVVRANLASLKVEFLDLVVNLAPNGKSAVVNLTAKIKVSTEKDIIPQELKITVKNVDGQWLIRKVETVKTLGSYTPPEVTAGPNRA